MQHNNHSKKEEGLPCLRTKAFICPPSPEKWGASTSLNRAHNFSEQQNNRIRPRSVSELQKRLEYLQKKMQSINLEDSSVSLGSQEKQATIRKSPIIFLSATKKRVTSHSRLKNSPRRSERLASRQGRKYKEEVSANKQTLKRSEQYKLTDKKQNAHIKKDNSKIRQRKTAFIKSLSRHKIKGSGLFENYNQTQKTINNSRKSEPSNEKHHKKLKSTCFSKNKLEDIEKQLVRYKKQNKKLKGKLKLLQNIQLDAKKLKNSNIRKVYFQKQYREGNTKLGNNLINKSLMRKGILL